MARRKHPKKKGYKTKNSTSLSCCSELTPLYNFVSTAGSNFFLYFLRPIAAFGYASVQFIYVVYTILYFVGAIGCRMTYKAPYAFVMLILSVLIAFPAALMQFPYFMGYLARLAGVKQEPPKKSSGCFSSVWYKWIEYSNYIGLFANGSNLMEQLSGLWQHAPKPTKFMPCIESYWTKPLPYTWRIAGAAGMYLLQREHARFYYAPTDSNLKKPLFGFLGTAISYAVGAFLMTAMPAIRFFMQQRDEGQAFSFSNEADFQMFIHLMIGIALMIPFRSYMYRNLYKDKYEKAHPTTVLPAHVNGLSDTDPQSGDDSDDSLMTEYEARETHKIQEHIKKEGTPWQKKLLIVLMTAGICGYQYYLSILGMRAVMEDMFAAGHGTNSTGVPATIDGLVVTDNTAAGFASFCRYMLYLI